jgi:hypothetical protein
VSNFGTFALYGLTGLWTIIAFVGTPEFRPVRHVVVPGLGLLANIMMLIAILYLYIIGNADSQTEAYICFAIAGGWAVISPLVVVTRVPEWPAPRRPPAPIARLPLRTRSAGLATGTIPRGAPAKPWRIAASPATSTTAATTNATRLSIATVHQEPGLSRTGAGSCVSEDSA